MKIVNLKIAIACTALLCVSAAAASQRKGTWVEEGGIMKFIVGRAAATAQAEAEAAYGREACDDVILIEPWISLDEVNEMVPRPGAKVLFRRGGVWRGQLQPRSGKPGHPIVYGAFGEGPSPVLEPSLDKSREDDWRRVEGRAGVWMTETHSGVDIGNVLFLDSAGDVVCCGVKKGSLAELATERDFWCDPESFCVYVKSAHNPATISAAVELAEKIHCIDEAYMHDVVYDGLALRFSAAHGIGGKDVKRITVRNCDISWIGGGYLYFDNAGRGVRYGNGIEFWGPCEDVLVERNNISQCWDAGLTNQSNIDGAVQRNIAWRSNTVDKCEYSYEYWQQGAAAVTENVCVEENIFTNAGMGWGHAQRWNPNGAHLMFYDTTAQTHGFTVRANVFGRSADTLMRMFNDCRDSLAFSGNSWDAQGTRLICRYHGRPRRELRYKYPDRLDTTHADNLAEIESQGSGARVFTPDALDEFLAFLAEFSKQ